MTPLERARARIGHVTPAGQPIAARPEGGGLAVPDKPAEPAVDRDIKPGKVTVTPTVLEEITAATRRIDAALDGAPAPARTPALSGAERRLDEIGADLAAGRATRAEMTRAIEAWEAAWMIAIRVAGRP